MTGRRFYIFLSLLCMLALAGCAGGAVFHPEAEISLISREDGSGTRSAFTELFQIVRTQDDGGERDETSLEAVITNSTSVMMTLVSGDPHAIGYVSLGTMSRDAKALRIDGAEGTVLNIEQGSYMAARSFYVVRRNDHDNPLADDFIRYLLSAEGQAIVEANGYVAAATDLQDAFSSAQYTGTLTIGGSSSVSPLMEKLKEDYASYNPRAHIEIHQSDSTTGMTAAAQGICDIGMSSRSLKQSELAQGLEGTVIARDGILVIVNHQNPLSDLTSEQIRAIFTGEIAHWNKVLP